MLSKSPPSQAPPQPRPRVHFNPEKSLSAKLFGIDFGNAFGKTFRRGSGVTPLRGYFKTSAGIFAAGHFRGLGESFCNHHLEGGLGREIAPNFGLLLFNSVCYSYNLSSLNA